MSDISSAELLQRYPTQSAPNNDFVKDLFDGLFDHVERKTIFEIVCHEINLLKICDENSSGAESHW